MIARRGLVHKSLLKAFAVCVATIVCVACATHGALTRLDELLQAGRTVQLAGELRRPSYKDAEMLSWLRERAEEGHVLPQFELASRLAARDKREALRWYARARLGWIMDEAECKPSGATSGLGFGLEVAYQSLDRLAKENEALFLAGMEEALELDAKGGPRPDLKWVCDPEAASPANASLLPAEARSKARAQAREKLLRSKNQLSQRVAAANMPLNIDGFPVRDAGAFRIRPSGQRVGYPAWLDEHRLLLVGAQANVAGLFVWDIRESAPRLYRAGVNDARYNARSGIVVYTITGSDGVRKGYRGPLGQEAETESWLNVSEDGPSMVERQRRYSVYARGFVEVLEHATGARDKPLGVRVFHDDKRVTQTAIPPGPWFHGSTFADISREGVVMGSDAFALRPGSVGHEGLYLIRNGTIQRLIAKHILSFSVSPDGCNVAYVEVPLNQGLRVVNVCAKGG